MTKTMPKTNVAQHQKQADMTFGGRVKIQMALRGINSPSELARRMGLPRQTISKWLNDEVRDVGLANLFKLSDTLDCSARWLATKEGTSYRAIRMGIEEKRLIDIYNAMPEAVRDSWIASGEALLAASTPASAVSPFRKGKI